MGAGARRGCILGFGTVLWKLGEGVAYYGTWRWVGKTRLIPIDFCPLQCGFLISYIIGTTYAMASGTDPSSARGCILLRSCCCLKNWGKMVRSSSRSGI